MRYQQNRLEALVLRECTWLAGQVAALTHCRSWLVRPSICAPSGWAFVGCFASTEKKLAQLFAQLAANNFCKCVKFRQYPEGFTVSVPLSATPPEAYGGPGGNEVLPGYHTEGVPSASFHKRIPLSARNAAAEADGWEK